MTFKIIETFSGIGSQAKALKNIQKINPNFKYSIEATVEWEIGAMYAYDILHNGPQDLSKYDNMSKESLVAFLSKYNISSDGKQPLKDKSLSRMSIEKLKSIKHSIEANKNLVDISKVKVSDLPEADLLTYSFPCQDLSISSYWHSNFTGINKDTPNRSGLLWEIERILNEYEITGKPMPRFLLMENVTAIHGPLHNQNF
ncbi:DNA cytosine methyltransferase, partial [Alkalibacterium sp.]